MEISSKLYITPEAEEITLSSAPYILSGSPQPGANENVGYEEWEI